MLSAGDVERDEQPNHRAGSHPANECLLDCSFALEQSSQGAEDYHCTCNDCLCPPLSADDERDKEDPIEEPQTPIDSETASSSPVQLVHVPTSILEQLPGYYWHGMEDDLEEEGFVLSLPWSTLDPEEY